MIEQYIQLNKQLLQSETKLKKICNDLIFKIFKEYDFNKNYYTHQLKYMEPQYISNLYLFKNTEFRLRTNSYYSIKEKIKDDNFKLEYDNLQNYLKFHFTKDIFEIDEFKQHNQLIEEINKIKESLKNKYQNLDDLGTDLYKYLYSCIFDDIIDIKNNLRKYFFNLELIDYNSNKELLEKIYLFENFNLKFPDKDRNEYEPEIFRLFNDNYEITFCRQKRCTSSYSPKYDVSINTINKNVKQIKGIWQIIDRNNFCSRSLDEIYEYIVDFIIKYIKLENLIRLDKI